LSVTGKKKKGRELQSKKERTTKKTPSFVQITSFLVTNGTEEEVK